MGIKALSCILLDLLAMGYRRPGWREYCGVDERSNEIVFLQDMRLGRPATLRRQ